MGSLRIFQRLPVVRLLIPLMAGIILQYHVNIPCRFLIPLIIASFLLTGILFLKGLKGTGLSSGLKFGYIVHIFILFASAGWTGRTMQSGSFIGHPGEFIVAVIRENLQERETIFRTIIEPVAVISGTRCTGNSGRAVAWIEKDSFSAALNIGDHIVIRNQMREIQNAGNPFEFDYKRYMYFQGVYGQVYLPAGSWFIPENHSSRKLALMPAKLRNRLLELLRSCGLTGREYTVASAMLLGSRDELDHETREIYSGSGAMHILAVSGLHVGILYLFLAWMVEPFKRMRYYRILAPLLMIHVIWFYALLTGLSPSVTRAATMFSFLALAKPAGRQSGTLNILASAAFVQLLAAPFALFMVGFQLSYLAVAGIICFQHSIYASLRVKNYLIRKIWSLVSISFSAQIFIFPLIIFYFNQFPSYFLVTNLIAVPLASLILYSGMLLFIFSFVPALTLLLSFVLNSALRFLNIVTESISLLPGSQIRDIFIDFPAMLLLYGIIACIILYIANKEFRFIKYTLILVIVLMGVRAASRIRDADRDIFIVYNSGNTSLYNFISGENNILISNSAGNETDVPYIAASPAIRLNASKFYVRSHNEFFAKNKSPVPSIILTEGNYVFFAGKRIFFAEDREPVYPMDVDILVVSSRTPPDISSICLALSPSVVIIDPSVPYFRKTRIKEHCINLGLSTHDVRESGAFIIRIRK